MSVCLVCKKEFKNKKHLNQKYCSRACAGLSRRLPLKVCRLCQKSFRPKWYGAQHCSQECAGPSYGWSKGSIRTRITKQCEVCNQTFETIPSSSKQFCCSSKCMGARRTLRAKWPQKGQCKECGKEFSKKKDQNKYCSRKCGAAVRQRNIRQKFPTKRSINGTFRAEIRAKHANKCAICGWASLPAVLELHHIDRNRKNNVTENLVLLCPNCHSCEHYTANDGNFWKKKPKLL